jgi:hypothetical protein
MADLTDCPCDDPPKRILRIPAGLPALPRQTQAFPEVRIALLAEIAQHPALDGWQAKGERDFGVMWLEMWAYVADVLGFYDERIANESYIRTAVRRPSLRRIVDLLGYVPAPGVAGSATIAAIAEGRVSVSVPQSTAFRSDAFGSEPPQVFEASLPAAIHALANSWEIGPVEVPVLTGSDDRTELIFETANFGLAKNRLVLIRWTDGSGPHREPRRVTSVAPFEGKDGKTYLRVGINAGVSIPAGFNTEDIEVQTPTVSAVLSKILTDPISNPSDTTTKIQLDSVYRQLHNGDLVISGNGGDETLLASAAVSVTEIIVAVESPVEGQPPAIVPFTEVTLDQRLEATNKNAYFFHFTFVDAGRLTSVAETEPTAQSLTSPVHPDGVLVTGIVERPPGAVETGTLQQRFLLRDVDMRGALVKGRMTFNPDGTARFRVDADEALPPTLKTPITVFGNVLEVSRGESVFDEILGNGDPRQLHQAFKLKKKPLTYFFDASVDGTHARSSLEVRVDGIAWHEVRSFFGKGPEDRVYIVRPDDQGDTFVIFGDGVRGVRPPSGIKNVRASYRFGSGEAAPPAGAIKQLAKAVKGLRRVDSPIAAVGGKDPDPPEKLRTDAPRTALLFGRAVSALDFEALVNVLPGIIKATAEFLWIEDQQEAGVVVTYIGTADEPTVLTAMRDQAEPNLPLDARQARAIQTEFHAEIDVHPDFDAAAVAAAVRTLLIDEDVGVLSTRNAPIGGRIFRSVVLDQMHVVPGVAAVTSAIVHVLGSLGEGNFKNSDIIGTCTTADSYLEFAPENVTVTGKTATSPVLDVEAAQ